MKSYIKNGLLLIIVFALVSVSYESKADEYVYMGAWSHHFSTPETKVIEGYEPPANHKCWKTNTCIIGDDQYIQTDFNENHRLLGYQKNSYLIGYFKNSYDQDTWFIDKTFIIDESSNIQLLASIGAQYGYTSCDFEDKGESSKLCPKIGFGFAYTKYKLQPVLSLNGKALVLLFRVKI